MRHCDRFGPAPDAQLEERSAEQGLHGLLADAEPVRYLCVRRSLRDEAENLSLPTRQGGVSRGAARMSGIEEAAPSENVAQRRDQFVTAATLDHASLRARLPRRFVQTRLGSRGHEHCRRCETAVAQVPQEICPVSVGQAIVDEQQPGATAAHERFRLRGRRGFPGEAELGAFERETHPRPHDRVVLDDENGQLTTRHDRSSPAPAALDACQAGYIVPIPDSGDGAHASMWMADAGPAADDSRMSEQAAVRRESETILSGDVTAAMVEGGRMAALGELAAGAAHEINNPLFAILTLVSFLIRDAEPGSKELERLQLIEDSAKDIQAVVEQVHGFARERRGEGGAVALETAIHGAVELVRHASASRTVQIVERHTSPPALVCGNAAQLKGLFVHLLVNAVQAMPDGGVVSVLVERRAGEVFAVVCDEGPGISATEAERVFELFHTTKSGSGTGLGLASARAIAELQGGSLTLDPGVERGARFVLRLPAAAG